MPAFPAASNTSGTATINKVTTIASTRSAWLHLFQSPMKSRTHPEFRTLTRARELEFRSGWRIANPGPHLLTAAIFGEGPAAPGPISRKNRPPLSAVLGRKARQGGREERFNARSVPFYRISLVVLPQT